MFINVPKDARRNLCKHFDGIHRVSFLDDIMYCMHDILLGMRSRGVGFLLRRFIDSQCTERFVQRLFSHLLATAAAPFNYSRRAFFRCCARLDSGPGR